MLELGFDYASCVRMSERVSWKLDELMPPGTQLDFRRKFLPEALAPTLRVGCLAPHERLALNQITGNAYLNLFQFVEEFILATAVKHAQAELFGDPDAVRALLRFAEEEAKHRQLFWRYRRAFDAGVGAQCAVLESAMEVAGVVLSHSPLAVMLVTCHIELMTQQHFTECVQGADELDPLFTRLLRAHWMEEAQHAKIDALELDKLAQQASGAQIARATGEYANILHAMDGLVGRQAAMDVESLGALTQRAFTADEAREVAASQHAGYQRTFLWYGMTNPIFERYLALLSPSGAAATATLAQAWR